MMRRRLLPLLAVAYLAGCAPAEPDLGELYTTWELVVATPSASDVNQRALDIIQAAETSLRFAAEDFDHQPIADAIVAAQARGVDVRVVGDVDRRDQVGFQRLQQRLQPVDGVVPIRLGDGPLVYNPQLVDEVFREGDHNRMTHNFVVADERRVLTVTGGFVDAPLHQVGIDVTSQYVGRDYVDEFQQLFGGMFASTLSTYNGPLKSDNNGREFYPSDNGPLRIHFGPQERLVKRVVDDVYGARASVHIVTEEFTNLPLASALRYKAEAGFEVHVVISSAGRDVPSSRADLLEDTFAGLDNASVAYADELGTNAVLIDADRSFVDGRQYTRRAIFLSEPLLAATSFVEGQVSTARAADAFTDANMFSIAHAPLETPFSMDAAVRAVRAHFDGGAR